uniref:Bromodomain adjacent to zinc finger domain protein 2A n=1 Tax=Gouania willdenowi TaxID=441366 RepID=A0A8C5E7V2_GOUWI
MDSNNHFNYGTHSSANSGLKRSSGDSSYTNGSSMSFPQQGKNMNGEMNVNGVTTVLGSNPPGSRPPSAPYPHMSSHHQSSMGYDYLWGGHTGYGAAMGTALGHGMHQKQPTPGMVQPQSQHPFQGHGHYQLNGGVETSHHPPAAGPANTPVSGNQYWNRGNLSPQQMSFSPHSMYGTYQNSSFNGSERTASSSYQCTSPAPSGSVGDGCSEKPTTYQETASPSQSMSSRLPVTSSTTAASASLIKASTPHGAPPLATLSGSPSSTPPQISSPPRMSFASSTTASSRLSSPPVLVKGPQAPTLVEMFPSEPKQPPAGPSSPSKSVTATKPATVFSAHAVSVLKESVVQTKSVLSHTGPSVLSTTVSPPIIVSTSSRSEPSDEKRTLHVSEVTSCFPGKPQSPHGNLEPEPSKLMSPPASPALCSPASVLKSKLCEPAPWSQSNTLPAAASGFPTVSARRSGVEGVIVASSAACASSPVRSLSTLPLLTTQASRTAPVPPPHPLVDESSPYIPRSEAGQSLNARRSSVRRVATEEQVQFPLRHGWRREIRVKKLENRMKGETWYYTPCGRRMKQFPEVIKYLKKHADGVVSREHFSFSPRMPVGDFYEERETAEGLQWVLLANEEIPSMIMAITGRRGRPPNPDKEKLGRPRALKGAPARRPGRPSKLNPVDLLSKVDAKLLQRLEAKGALTEEDKVKLAKIKKKMRRKARVKRREDAKIKKYWIICLHLFLVLGARSKAKALAKAQAEAEAAAQAALAAKKSAERRVQAQRRLEERKRQQLIAEELKKPTEDMCLTDHKPLPELSRIPGVVLSGTAFAHCLAVVEFLHGYGKLMGLNIPKDIPSLVTLQEGLLGLGDSQGEVQDLLIKLMEIALQDPGLPSYYQSVKILGDKLVDLELTRSTVSEVLRIFLESHGYETEVCDTLRTKTFHALPPDTKAAILGFLVDELNGNNVVTSDIDNTLENMTTYRKNKWIIEGKLRKLKTALARRTGRSEEEICFEERRRSARVAEEENLNLVEKGLALKRGNRRGRKEDESPNNASIPELERQIDKLTKRQAFFRKKLLQSSHSMRAILLGQDRYRRRYIALPHLGGVFVEGAEELLNEELATPTTPPNNLPGSPSAPVGPALTSSAEDDDPLPGTASLMSQPRGRGRPRKIKPEVELHLRTAKIRRRRRSSVRSVGDVGPGLPNNELTQAALQSWLSQSQEAASTNTCSGAGEAPEGHGASSFPPNQSAAEPETNETPQGLCEAETIPQLPPTLLPSLPTLEAPPLGPPALTAPALRAAPKPGRRRRRGSRGSSPARRGPRGAAAKRRGRPPNAVFQELEQQYFTQLVVKPIPASMMRGWWWIKDPEELYNTLQALHPRGIREKVLHKHLAKHMESLTEMYQLFDVKEEKKNVWLEALQQPWQVQEKAMETDVLALQRVEDLEQRVVAADLHLKVRNLTNDSDATRDDLQYYEHDADPRDDWIVRTKKEWSNLPRIATHPLDLAVLRLANLERNIERRYLKEPLWNPAEVMRLAPLTPTPGEDLESEITSRMRTWRQALDRCRSAPQVVLCLHQLEKAIAWERSVTKVNCQVCRKGDNDECLLLCDGCDRGCHMYCLKPKITQVPEGDWFCPTCVAKEETASPRSSKTRTRVKKKRYEDDSSDDESTTRRSGGGMATRHKEPAPNPSSSSRNSGEAGSSAKRRRMTTRNQPDLTFCEIILMEMEAHTDAWPFLEPVNPRLVPGYRRLIKNPMDFLTMRERLLQGGYCSCEEFAADAHLVFNNCEMFNEDTSEVGMAGHSMRKFFESRWAEFYSNKDK